MNTIVIGVDGSETAARAAQKAADLAVATGATLHVLSAYGKFEMEKYSSGSEEFIFSTEKDAETTANGVLARLRGTHPELTVTSGSAEGKPGEALVKEAARLQADLIVVGNKRVQGVSRVLGSVARDVATRASCDVYIAHTRQR